MNISGKDISVIRGILKKLPYQQTVGQFVSSSIQHYISKLKKDKVI